MDLKRGFLAESWKLPLDKVFSLLETSDKGLDKIEAQKRIKIYGPNETVKTKNRSFLPILLSQFENWLILVLLAAAVLSFILGGQINAIVIISLVAISVILGFFQEYRSEKAFEELKKYITHQTKVLRDGEWIMVNNKALAIGDILDLRSGDIVPADVRLFEIDNLAVNEALLTGESFPIDKTTEPVVAERDAVFKLKNMLFMGTAIETGIGKGIVVAVGENTFIGQMAKDLEQTFPETEFQKQTKKFSTFLFKVIIGITAFVFAVNTLLGKGLFDSFLFAVALSVGITPELLPAIMSITLSQGAMKLAKKKVIVKRLMSIENLGNMDTLCLDKTGTLTEGKFFLSDYLDLSGKQDEQILLNALLSTSGWVGNNKAMVFEYPTDKALWESDQVQKLKKNVDAFSIINENEFDHTRRRVSVLVSQGKKRYLVSKGAGEEMLSVCSSVLINGKAQKLDRRLKNKLEQQIKDWEQKGCRVLAVAKKEFEGKSCTLKDETNLSWQGVVIFKDPLKQKIKQTIGLFKDLNVNLKVVSGDSVIVSRYLAQEAGLEFTDEQIISGEDLDKIDKKNFLETVDKTVVFARVSPEQKKKIVQALNYNGNVVGFLGDGANDASALKAADIGISVDTAMPVAKEAADIILLRKDLTVLAEGIETGRKTFGNVTKYILNTVSANYGNMFTVAISSLFLKFIPLLPSQILLNNLISDVPLFTVATDNVDKDFTKKPKRFNVRLIAKFMIYFGFISSFFDLMLIIPLIFVFKATPEVFRTAWFVESSLSEILVTFIIRTKMSFFKSRPSKWLVASSAFSIGLVLIMASIPFGKTLFDFSSVPTNIWVLIGLVVVSYLAITELVKQRFFLKTEF